MNKEQLGAVLSHLRGGSSVEGLTKYAVKSIEEGRSSYPVANLMSYCEALSIQMAIKDMATDEIYPVDTVKEVHEVLQMLMKRWQISVSVIYQKANVHYTVPKAGKNTLSITTMLAMCKVLHCKLCFIK